MELLRGVWSQFSKLLISSSGDQDLAPMSLDLSHSQVEDNKIIEAIRLLDDLDKKLKKHALMLKKQYGPHFPKLAKIIEDNLLYAKTVKLMRNRSNAMVVDFSEILEDEIEAQVKEAAVISTGKEVSDLDLKPILELCDQVVSLAEDKAKLYADLKSRMNTVAPNLTALVGELVGARLISRGGGLRNLANQHGCNIQILGAKKAPFRSLKRRENTPQYGSNGLISHAPLVGQVAPELKRRILRSLAAKAALAIRCDAFGDGKDNTVGLKSRAKIEERLRQLERKVKSNKDKKMGPGGHAKTCNSAAESLLRQTPSKSEAEDGVEPSWLKLKP